jgi:hypothetical protein
MACDAEVASFSSVVMAEANHIRIHQAVFRNRSGVIVLAAILWVMASGLVAGTNAKDSNRENEAIPSAFGYQRKALVLGQGLPLKEPNGGPTHPQGAKDNFLKLMGNPRNNPKKGWTCDLSYDLMLRLGMDPKTTSFEELFNYIGKHHLGYRIVMNNQPGGQALPFWGAAVDNGMMPFAAHLNNSHTRYEDPIGIKSAVSVGGGGGANCYSYGPSLELYDALPKWLTHQDYEDAAESWANQVVAAKFAKILDAHPSYNIWDARQHMRQAASHYAEGWTEQEGFGRVNENAVITNLLPGMPVEFWGMKSRDNRKVVFTWRNFLQSDFAATVIARSDGRIIYEGTGTNFTWASDIDGGETFKYWSKNRAGVASRFEAFNTRTIEGLAHLTNQTCLILGAPVADAALNQQLHDQFQKAVPQWICDIVYRMGSTDSDGATNFPNGTGIAVLPNYPAMVSYAIEHKYRMLIVPASKAEKTDLYSFKGDWDRATANGIMVILPHHFFGIPLQLKRAYRERPLRLFSAVVVGGGMDKNERTFGPGLEFFDYYPAEGVWPPDTNPNAGAACLAATAAKIMDAHTNYNIWDVRQHLRQSASHYAAGWTETNGYGRPPLEPIKLTALDSAPPVEIQAIKSADGKTVTFSWENFLQGNFLETQIARRNGNIIYHGTGTNFLWKSDMTGDEEFRFSSKSKDGMLSKPEPYTIMPIKGLVPY